MGRGWEKCTFESRLIRVMSGHTYDKSSVAQITSAKHARPIHAAQVIGGRDVRSTRTARTTAGGEYVPLIHTVWIIRNHVYDLFMRFESPMGNMHV